MGFTPSCERPLLGVVYESLSDGKRYEPGPMLPLGATTVSAALEGFRE